MSTTTSRKRSHMSLKDDITFLDLTSVSRDTEVLQCDVYLKDPSTFEEVHWIRSGAVCMSYNSNLRTWNVGCRMTYGVTDEEHDGSWAWKFTANGLELTHSNNGYLYFEGWIGSYCEGFHIPSPNDPPKFKPCADCTIAEGREPHDITRYIPPTDPQLWSRLRGIPFQLIVHPPHDTT